VTVRGIMMHAEGFKNKRTAAWRFLQVGDAAMRHAHCRASEHSIIVAFVAQTTCSSVAKYMDPVTRQIHGVHA
jgi:hypothetical protein